MRSILRMAFWYQNKPPFYRVITRGGMAKKLYVFHDICHIKCTLSYINKEWRVKDKIFSSFELGLYFTIGLTVIPSVCLSKYVSVANFILICSQCSRVDVCGEIHGVTAQPTKDLESLGVTTILGSGCSKNKLTWIVFKYAIFGDFRSKILRWWFGSNHRIYMLRQLEMILVRNGIKCM